MILLDQTLEVNPHSPAGAVVPEFVSEQLGQQHPEPHTLFSTSPSHSSNSAETEATNPILDQTLEEDLHLSEGWQQREEQEDTKHHKK